MKKVLVISVAMTAVSFAENATSNAFNGFYVGAGVGFIRDKINTDLTPTSDNLIGYLKSVNIPVTSTKTSNGFLFGIYTGYGKSFNNFYVGAEISVTDDTVKRKVNLVNAADPAEPSKNYEANVKYKRGLAFGVAPRFGYVFDNNVIYLKTGFEISHDKSTATYNGTNSLRPERNVSVSASKNKRNIVFTPSFGYEKSCNRIIFRGEYTYNPGKKMLIAGGDDRLDGYNNASYSDHRLVFGIAYKI